MYRYSSVDYYHSCTAEERLRYVGEEFIAYRYERPLQSKWFSDLNSHLWSIFIEMLLTHALALASSQFVHQQKALGIYTRMDSGALEITEFIYAQQARGWPVTPPGRPDIWEVWRNTPVCWVCNRRLSKDMPAFMLWLIPGDTGMVSWRADKATPERGTPINERWKTCQVELRPVLLGSPSTVVTRQLIRLPVTCLIHPTNAPTYTVSSMVQWATEYIE